MILTTKHLSIALAMLLASACGKCMAVTLFSSQFQTTSESFTYRDNTFRNTTRGSYASGRHVNEAVATVERGYLEVKLGGIDSNIVFNMSGGWVREFTLPQSSEVTLQLNYKLYMTPDYEKDEFAQALCSIDGKLVSNQPGMEYIGQLHGQGSGLIAYNWVTLNIGVLSAGTHRLVVGAYSNKKTWFNEESLVRYSSVILDYFPVSATTAPVKPLTLAPTKAPIRPVTRAPIRPVTRAPIRPVTRAPTRAPIRPVTRAPIRPVTRAPIRPATRAPIKPATKAPTRSPIKAATKAPTAVPVKPETRTPTSAPVKPKTEAPTDAPIKPKTEAPTNAPMQTKTEAPTNVPIKTPPSTEGFVTRINVGSNDVYVDPKGQEWEPDKYFDGKGGMFSQCPMEISNTESDGLYCKERYFNIWATPKPYQYNIPVPKTGYYSVKLHFAEIYYTTKDQRVFDVVVNGKPVFKQLDIVEQAGPNAALIIPSTVQVRGSSVTIELIPLKENPKICAIEVIELPDYVPPPTSAPVAQAFNMLINCGGNSFVESVGGRTWNADQYFIGGNVYTDGSNTVDGTLDYNLYQTERYGEFKYEIPVPTDGSYEVILHFAELYWQGIGQRLFNVVVENQAMMEKVDIVALGNGKRLQAVTVESLVTVTDGFVSIALSNSIPQVDNPKLSGIEIIAK